MRAWLRLFILMSVLVAILSLIFSVWLIPSRKDRALMLFRDGQFEQSKELYESLYQAGDVSSDVIIPLSKLQLQFGDVDKAITLMEHFLQDQPLHEEARRQLGIFYQYAQRPLDYLRNLETVQSQFPSAFNLRELGDIYNYYGRYEDQRRVLEQLVAEYEPTQEDILKLSYLKAQQQEYNVAAGILSSLKDIDNLTLQTADMAVSLMLDAGEVDGALTFARQYLAAHDRDITQTLTLASRVKSKGHPKAALSLLEYISNDTLYLHPEWLEKVIDIRLAAGEGKAVFGELSYLLNEKLLPSRIAEVFLELAVEQHQLDYVQLLLRSFPLSKFTDSALLGVMSELRERDESSALQTIAGRMDKGFRASRPILAIAMDMALGRFISDERFSQLQSYYDAMQMEHKMTLARIMYTVQLHEPLRMLFDNILTDEEAPHYRREIARIYLILKQVNEGVAWLNQQQVDYYADASAMEEIGELTLWFSAAQGKKELIEAWLQSNVSTGKEGLAKQLYFVAFDYGQTPLILALAKYLYEKFPNEVNRYYLAEAYTVNHQYAQALPYLRDLEGTDSENIEALYVTALLEASKKDDSLKGELHTVLTKMLERPAIMPEKRREIAYILLDHGYKKQSENAFFALAQNAKPDDPVVGQLLYLWGPRPEKRAIKWLEENSYQAKTDEEQAGWLEHLLYAGEAQRIITMLEKDLQFLKPAVANVYLQALQQQGKKEQVTKAIEVILMNNQELPIGRLLVLGRMAKNHGALLPARYAYAQVVREYPDNHIALQELVEISYALGKYQEAQNWISSYLAQGWKNYLVNYYYAEMLRQERREAQAERYYKQALELLLELPKEIAEEEGLQRQSTLAQLYYRLGDAQSAIGVYKDMLALHPQNGDVRADYAALLIDLKRFSEAESIMTP